MYTETERLAAVDRYLELLTSVNRDNADKLIEWLKTTDFFTAPASTRFHGCYPGGLLQHHLRVYELLHELSLKHDFNSSINPGQRSLPVNEANIIVACLTHDFCKINHYQPTVSGGYTWVRGSAKGHALLSLKLILQYMPLMEIEVEMIRFHMGVYGLNEFEERTGEYNLRNEGLMHAWHHNPIVKFMYFCDEISSLEERKL